MPLSLQIIDLPCLNWVSFCHFCKGGEWRWSHLFINWCKVFCLPLQSLWNQGATLCVCFWISEWQTALEGAWLALRPGAGEKIKEGLREEDGKRTLKFFSPFPSYLSTGPAFPLTAPKSSSELSSVLKVTPNSSSLQPDTRQSLGMVNKTPFL